MRLVAYGGDDDRAAMKALVRTAWQARGPHVECLPGDLDWRLDRYPCDPEHHIVLCRDGDALAGFAWRFGVKSEVDLVLAGDVQRATDLLIDWSEDVEEGAPPATIYALETHAVLRARLASRGYRPTETGYLHFVQRVSDSVPTLPWASGYRAASMAELAHAEDEARARDPAGRAGADPCAARAALHRAAFGSSRVTRENYARVMQAPDYRDTLDLVALDAAGELAAFVLVWFDAALGVAVCEPVGTHPSHRGRGLAKALLAEARTRVAALGARELAVCAFAADPITPTLYRDAGFRCIDRNVAHRRDDPT